MNDLEMTEEGHTNKKGYSKTTEIKLLLKTNSPDLTTYKNRENGYTTQLSLNPNNRSTTNLLLEMGLLEQVVSLHLSRKEMNFRINI